MRTGAVLTLPDAPGGCTVVREIARGGQGAVFEVVVDGLEAPHALKWYHPASATSTQRARIAELVERGAPSDRFLWPTTLVDQPGERTFGYLMPLRPDHYVSLADLLTRRVDPPFTALVTLCMELAHAFLLLHSQGLCYRDISWANVFVDPATGAPLICDNDNVAVDGAPGAGVLGTSYFMAPEIVRGQGRVVPSTRTDLHSLAVLLFYVLMLGHPLLGARYDALGPDDEAEGLEELLGRRPVFVFDERETGNRPGAADDPRTLNWQLHPRFVRELFTAAFTRGLHDPEHGRVQESVWRRAMARLRDLVQECPGCGQQNLFDDERAGRPCWSCRVPLPSPLRLDLGHQVLVLNRGTRLARHHLHLDYDFESVLGEVVPHPSRPGVFGLRNVSGDVWATEIPGGGRRELRSGQAVGLIRGTRLELGHGLGPAELLA